MFLYSPHTSSFWFIDTGWEGGGGCYSQRVKWRAFKEWMVSMEGGRESWLEAMLDESQMTVACAIQCRYPMEFDLEKHFLLRKKSHLKKSVLIFLFLSFSPPFSEACSSFILYCFQISTSFSSSVFPRSLQEADCPDLDSKLLVSSADIHRGNVHYGQTRGLLRPVFDHCLAPLSRVFLWTEKQHRCC